MLIDGRPYRTIWPLDGGRQVQIIDQTRLPHVFVIRTLETLADIETAIREMQVRGAPLIGATAAYGFVLALYRGLDNLAEIGRRLCGCRPTAVNLAWAVQRMQHCLTPVPAAQRPALAAAEAAAICDEDVTLNCAIGDHGLALLRRLWQAKNGDGPLRVLTHCNAGWLATVDWGTALAPIYKAAEAGIPLQVWVDETRPRSQGARLTAWELGRAGIAHQLLVDGAAGHLLQRGQVDCCIVGTDRTAANGDVCNKIGTYPLALSAADNRVPFYVALPSPTLDWQLTSGLDIPIEQRSQAEVLRVEGLDAQGVVQTVQIAPTGTTAFNPAFDVTPARLVTGLITERGICAADGAALKGMFAQPGV